MQPCDRQQVKDTNTRLTQSACSNTVDKAHHSDKALIWLHAGLAVHCDMERVIIEFVACTCCVPLQPPGLCPVVIGWGSLRQDLDCLAEQLKCSLQIPSLCCWNTPHLQLFHLLQQLCVKATVWKGEINRLKTTQTQLTGTVARKTQNCHPELNLD